jgi:hypothetical protein
MLNIPSLLRALLPGKVVRRVLSLTGLLSLLLAACAPVLPSTRVPLTQPAPTGQQVPTQAHVQSVKVHVPGGDTTQVHAIVDGMLMESCAKLGESQVEYDQDAFQITVYTFNQADVSCAPAETDFETTVPLDISGLAPGTYTVTANGVSAVFTLPAETPTATPLASPMPSPVPSAVASPVSGAAPTAVPTAQGCVEAAAFVSDVTVPDNTVLAPNTPFTKTWRLKNTGSCTWDNTYLVAYISGTTMSQQPGYWIVPPGQAVAPGQSVDISVGMTSPPQDGSYSSSWGLKRENGAWMQVQGGANGNSFYVKIRVSSGGSGEVTGASIGIDLEQGSGTACTPDATYFVHASITADGPTTASYEINSTAGQIAAGNFQDPATSWLAPEVSGTVSFDEAGARAVHLRFVGPYPYPQDITVNLRVNGGAWHSTRLSCGS